MSNFWQRALTGALFVIVLVSAILYNVWSFITLFTLVAAGATLEFYTLFESTDPQVKLNKTLGVLITVGLTFLLFVYAQGGSYGLILTILIPLLASIPIIELFKQSDRPFQNISYTLLGPIYAGFPFALLSFLAFYQSAVYNAHFILAFFLLLWTNDTGAYLCGKALGRHKLFERISPKKTWEGFIGGVLLTGALGIYLSFLYPEISFVDGLVMALIISVFGTLGDLIESMLKRSLNVKDSGSVLPGHGGLLDRFDGLLLSVPVLFFYLELRAHI